MQIGRQQRIRYYREQADTDIQPASTGIRGTGSREDRLETGRGSVKLAAGKLEHDRQAASERKQN